MPIDDDMNKFMAGRKQMPVGRGASDEAVDDLWAQYQAMQKRAKPKATSAAAARKDTPEVNKPAFTGGGQPAEIPYDQTAGSFPGAYAGSAYERRLMTQDRKAQAAPAAQPPQSRLTPKVVEYVNKMDPQRALADYYDLRASVNLRDPGTPQDMRDMADLLKARAAAGGAEHGKDLKPQPLYVPRVFGGGK